MSEIYSSTSGFVNVQATAEELGTLQNNSGVVGIIIHRVQISQSTDFGDSEAAACEVRLYRQSPAGTVGGGDAVTPVGISGDDLSLGFNMRGQSDLGSHHASNLSILYHDVFHLAAGWVWQPPPDMRIRIGHESGAEFFVWVTPGHDTTFIQMACTIFFEVVR